MTELNLKYVEVNNNKDNIKFSMLADDNLKNIIKTKQPIDIYNKIPKFVETLVLDNKPIPLNIEKCHVINGKLFVSN